MTLQVSPHSFLGGLFKLQNTGWPEFHNTEATCLEQVALKKDAENITSQHLCPWTLEITTSPNRSRLKHFMDKIANYETQAAVSLPVLARQ